jgi:hypothetical protein
MGWFSKSERGGGQGLSKFSNPQVNCPERTQKRLIRAFCVVLTTPLFRVVAFELKRTPAERESARLERSNKPIVTVRGE